MDTIGYAGGSNLYAYVNDDPVNEVDPGGLLGILYSTGGTIEGGGPVGLQGAVSANVGFGGFVSTNWSNLGSISEGAFSGGAAFAGIAPFGAGAQGQPSLSAGYPTESNALIIGAFAGRGSAVSLTPANTVADLAGGATVYSLNTLWFSFKFSLALVLQISRFTR